MRCPTHRQHRRRAIKLRQPGGVVIASLEQECGPGSFVCCQLCLGNSTGCRFQRPPATLGQFRDGAQRGGGTAIALQQQAERHRAYIRCPDQPQMSKTFLAVHTKDINR